MSCDKEHTVHIDEPQHPTKGWITCGDETVAEVTITDDTDFQGWMGETMRVHNGE